MTTLMTTLMLGYYVVLLLVVVVVVVVVVSSTLNLQEKGRGGRKPKSSPPLVRPQPSKPPQEPQGAGRGGKASVIPRNPQIPQPKTLTLKPFLVHLIRLIWE